MERLVAEVAARLAPGMGLSRGSGASGSVGEGRQQEPTGGGGGGGSGFPGDDGFGVGLPPGWRPDVTCPPFNIRMANGECFVPDLPPTPVGAPAPAPAPKPIPVLPPDAKALLQSLGTGLNLVDPGAEPCDEARAMLLQTEDGLESAQRRAANIAEQIANPATTEPEKEALRRQLDRANSSIRNFEIEAGNWEAVIEYLEAKGKCK